ncbi:MAG: hypothetical protein J7498_02345 [Sphingobium sp.]|nr:hypothetical protein [Sphingobium sp.]
MDDDKGLSEGEPWFEPKRFGYGAGLPIAWQGWVLTGGFLVGLFVLIVVTGALARTGSILAAAPVAALVALMIGFGRICARHTRGGWRWRWGGDD